MKPSCFGNYILLERIACGGMGEVFTALPASCWGTDRFVALKRMLRSLGPDTEFLQRFQDEVRLVLQMKHPNVVEVFEAGQEGSEHYIVMELVEGRDLRQIISRLSQWRDHLVMPIPAALYIVGELLAGLHYCHQHTNEIGEKLGVVHRDVCPSNVLVSYDGAVKLADFGLALSDLKCVQTDPCHLLGHLGYIAPECTWGGGSRVDHRADIYSAGVLLFELLTGERFLSSKNLCAMVREMAVRSNVRPSELRPEIPRAVDALVSRAVATDPDERFATALEFHQRLRHVLTVLDPLFGARELAETVMAPVFRPAHRRQRLQRVIRSVDLADLLRAQPGIVEVPAGPEYREAGEGGLEKTRSHPFGGVLAHGAAVSAISASVTLPLQGSAGSSC